MFFNIEFGNKFRKVKLIKEWGKLVYAGLDRFVIAITLGYYESLEEKIPFPQWNVFAMLRIYLSLTCALVISNH